MPNASNPAADLALAGLVGVPGYMSLHSANPGTVGAAELVGSPYTRQLITWSTPASGSVYNSTVLTFLIPSSALVAGFGIWSALSGGTYYIGNLAAASQQFVTSNGSLQVPVGFLTITAS